MKKFLKLLILSVLVALSACCFACTEGEGGSGKTGLLYKKFSGDEYYTVYGYVDEGLGVTDLVIPDKVIEEDGSESYIGKIKANSFAGNSTLKSIVVPDTVVKMDGGAFAGMMALEELTIPFVGGVITADDYYNQTGEGADKAVDKERTFGYLFGTTEYNFGTKITQKYDDKNTATYYLPVTLEKVTISEKATNIPMYAFAGVTSIKTVELPSSLVSIGECAFNGCAMLNNVVVPASVKTIYDGAFSDCINLNSVTFKPNSELETIGAKAFKGSSIMSITLPNSVTSIGDYAFAQSKIRTITLPSSVSTISGYAFYKCEYLTSVATSATAIKEYAFNGCVNLATFNSTTMHLIDLTGVTELGAMSFAELGEVNTYTVNSTLSSNVIENAFLLSKIA